MISGVCMQARSSALNIQEVKEDAERNNLEGAVAPLTTLCTQDPSYEVIVRVKRAAIDAMKLMCTTSSHRLTEAVHDPALLNTGLFYMSDYFKALSLIGPNGERRRELMLAKGSLYHGFASPAHFLIENSTTSHPRHRSHITGKIILGYRIKQGVLASEALKSMMTGLSLVDSEQVCLLSYYKALLDILGTRRFNALFADLSFHLEDSKNPIRKLLKRSTAIDDKLSIGEIVCVNNAKCYRVKHPYGEAQSYNVLCIENGSSGESLFVGLGLGGSGVNFSHIRKKLLNELNSATLADDRIGQSHKTEFVRASAFRARELDSRKLNENKFRADEGGKFTSVAEINFERLYALVNADTDEEAVSLFEAMSQEI